MPTQRTKTDALISSLEILARDIESDDGVANAAILEAAQRLKEFKEIIRKERKAVERFLIPHAPRLAPTWIDFFVEEGVVETNDIGWILAKEID